MPYSSNHFMDSQQSQSSRTIALRSAREALRAQYQIDPMLSTIAEDETKGVHECSRHLIRILISDEDATTAPDLLETEASVLVHLKSGAVFDLTCRTLLEHRPLRL